MSVLSCPHCGSALTALDVETAPLRCPVCGATLGSSPSPEELPIREAIVREEDDSATRAVPREQLAPVVARVIADHQAATPLAAPGDDTTQALPASASPAAAHSATTDARDVTQELPLAALPPEPPARRSRAGVSRAVSAGLAALVLLGVVVVSVLAVNGVIGGATTIAATPTVPLAATTPTPAGIVFGVPHLYQVAYPRGWLVTQRNAPTQTYYALLTAPSGGSSFNVEAQQVSAPALDTLDEQFLDSLAQQGTSPSLVGAPAHVTVGGQDWTQLTADMTLRVLSGQPKLYAHAVALSTVRGSYAYTIVYLTPSSDPAAAQAAFTTADAAYFQPLLASFTFLS